MDAKIVPVAKPASFDDVKFTRLEYETAVRIGPMVVPMSTALENIKASRGLYEIEPIKRAEVDVTVGGMTIDTMGPAELKMAALHLGVTLRKKNMKISELRILVKSKLDDIVVIDEDDLADDSDDPGDETSA